MDFACSSFLRMFLGFSLLPRYPLNFHLVHLDFVCNHIHPDSPSDSAPPSHSICRTYLAVPGYN